MKALSIRQPWAWLIIEGHKDVENRTWSTKYRGDLLIHTSKTKRSYRAACRYVQQQFEIEIPPAEQLHFGMIIGKITVVDCREYDYYGDNSPWHAREQFGWYLEDPVRFDEPLPYRGQLGLFNVDLDAELQNEDSQPNLFD